MEQYDLAVADAGKVIELDPGYHGAYRERAYTYNGLEQYDLAIADAGKAIELNPEYADTYTALGKKAEAIADYETVITMGDNPQGVAFAQETIAELSE